MSTQTTLTEDAPMILDATCSTKKHWPVAADVRVDNELWKKPELCADDTSLPFPNAVFDILYCDPPHLINSKKFERPTTSASYASTNRTRMPHEHFLHAIGRFGNWTSRGEWYSYLEGTNIEFARVLKPSGVLKYKLCEALSHGKGKTVLRADLVRMTNFTIESVRQTTSKYGKNKVYWLTMKPKPQEGGR